MFFGIYKYLLQIHKKVLEVRVTSHRAYIEQLIIYMVFKNKWSIYPLKASVYVS